MNKTILLADDSVTIRKVVELTFMEEDYQLVSVGSGEEAVEKLGATRPDLVIADVHMPGLDGFEVCRRAKELDDGRPVLLLVGTFEPFDVGEMEASRADAHLKKPFDSQELLRRVRELLAEAGESSGPGALGAAGDAPPAAPEVDSGQAEVPGPESGLAPEALAGPMAPSEEPEIPEKLPEAAREALSGGETGASDEGSRAAAASDNGGGELSQETIERIARRVAEILGPEVLRDVAWEVIPDLAEVVIKERLRELEGQVE